MPLSQLDFATEELEGAQRQLIEQLANDVLVERRLNSTALVYNILTFIDDFKEKPKTV